MASLHSEVFKPHLETPFCLLKYSETTNCQVESQSDLEPLKSPGCFEDDDILSTNTHSGVFLITLQHCIHPT